MGKQHKSRGAPARGKSRRVSRQYRVGDKVVFTKRGLRSTGPSYANAAWMIKTIISAAQAKEDYGWAMEPPPGVAKSSPAYYLDGVSFSDPFFDWDIAPAPSGIPLKASRVTAAEAYRKLGKTPPWEQGAVEKRGRIDRMLDRIRAKFRRKK